MSKNQSGLGFKKKASEAVETNRYEIKGFQKRAPLREDSYTNRSQKHELSKEKSVKSHQQESSSSHKKSIYEEEETLEEQGYGVLIRDMKRCLKGDSREEINWSVDEKIAPKYLEMNKIPGISDKDTLGSKI